MLAILFLYGSPLLTYTEPRVGLFARALPDLLASAYYYASARAAEPARLFAFLGGLPPVIWLLLALDLPRLNKSPFFWSGGAPEHGVSRPEM